VPSLQPDPHRIKFSPRNNFLTTRRHRLFRATWWICNLLLAVTLISTIYSAAWEYSVRTYLDGFSDAIVPDLIPAEEKINYILNWMGNGPSRMVAADPSKLSSRDPESTLNYKQLLAVCGSATNAFINLARSSDLKTRRLLLLGPDNRVKHVVAEVLLDQRWVIVDPAFRVILKDSQGRLLTRKDLQDPAIFWQATHAIPNYLPEYNYDNFAHVRITRFPIGGVRLKHLLDSIRPDWDERVDWTLLLERKSFFFLFIFFCGTLFFLLLRFFLAWYADNRICVPRFRLRAHLQRAGSSLPSLPEIK
jgi:hypothetical protein